MRKARPPSRAGNCTGIFDLPPFDKRRIEQGEERRSLPCDVLFITGEGRLSGYAIP